MSRDTVRSGVAEARVRAASRSRTGSLTPQTLVLLGFVTASLLVGRGFTAFAPGHADARIFAYIGREWLSGVIPYVDVWDNKPPGIFATIALVFALFPDNFGALAVLEGVWVALCHWSIFTLLRQFGAPWDAAAVATAASAVACNLLYYNEHGVITEIYVLGPAALSMVCFVKAWREQRVRWMFGAGLCTGLAALYKPPGLAPFLAQVSFLGVLGLLHQHGWRLVLRGVGVNACGIIVAWAPCVWYFWRHGALFALFDATLFYNLTYGASSQRGVFHSLLSVVDRLQPLAPLAVGALVVAVRMAHQLWASRRAVLAREQEVAPCTRWGLLGVLWVGGDLAGALAGGRHYAHYFLPLTPSLSLLGGLAYWTLAAPRGGAPAARHVRLGIAALLLGPLLIVQLHDANHLRAVLTQGRVQEVEDRALEFLAHTRTPTDTLFTWDCMPLFYFALKMRSPSRYLGADYIRDSPVTAAKIRERLVNDLDRQPPSFVVDKTNNPTERGAADPAYRWFQHFLAHKYRLAFAENSMRIYVLDRARSPILALQVPGEGGQSGRLN
jgi:Dolichyl-phosphate-mannose-protein mannosyltransferase